MSLTLDHCKSIHCFRNSPSIEGGSPGLYGIQWQNGHRLANDLLYAKIKMKTFDYNSVKIDTFRLICKIVSWDIFNI